MTDQGDKLMEDENKLSVNGSIPLHILMDSLKSSNPITIWHPINMTLSPSKYLNAKILLVNNGENGNPGNPITILYCTRVVGSALSPLSNYCHQGDGALPPHVSSSINVTHEVNFKAHMVLIHTVNPTFIHQMHTIEGAFVDMTKFKNVSSTNPRKQWNHPTPSLVSYSISHNLFANHHEMVKIGADVEAHGSVHLVLEQAVKSCDSTADHMFVCPSAPNIIKHDNSHYSGIHFTSNTGDQIQQGDVIVVTTTITGWKGPTSWQVDLEPQEIIRVASSFMPENSPTSKRKQLGESDENLILNRAQDNMPSNTTAGLTTSDTKLHDEDSMDMEDVLPMNKGKTSVKKSKVSS
ncbi:hypothetical protein BS47DRAFT_1366048 [Hydnum rufescens UP504]|uniref:Uncharacterized protein n=1 Tax=Hydnum rufescens UP504 TaxID=1448309 RepID=A0A9P6DR99_9AGAM|nr:hypothetical protein BS47DRAFT_1366048 [Hydnum rufescens UP504]